MFGFNFIEYLQRALSKNQDPLLEVRVSPLPRLSDFVKTDATQNEME